ncbi:hypothetical protein N7517_002640 [Penicillium concentricum]|uniref:Uncharacterized protein n=1 Tax=Penicillium concentricum TaxID=293559 RepID=A0A9W9VKW3_9EURO|nr:uncharacterized protein N7517_002640 [Penicillium concentricum]KAJ5384729.1 hypothetical protein N7517_002640 [Penicillium concentricum]
MGETEIEDFGIPVNDIIDDRIKLEAKAKQETGQDVELDSQWTDVEKIQFSENVCAVLLRKQNNQNKQNKPGGVARVEGEPPRYILTDKVNGIVLVAAKPGEKIILLGQPSVRCFRRRNP